MPVGTDSWRRPVYIDRRNSRFFAEPLIGNGVWPEVVLSPGMFAPIAANTLLGRYGTSGAPSALSADVVIDLINAGTTSTINAARVIAGSTSGAGVLQLTDSTGSTSTTTAATPNAVKSAYDLANAALPKSGGVLTGDVTLNAQSDLRFADADSSNWVAFQAPAVVAANVTWTLPSADGASGQTLSSNGSGVLSWVTRAALDTAQTYTAAQRGTVSALTSASTVTPDFAVANNYSLSLAHSVTLANPSNLTAGQSGSIVITQNASTAYTVSYGSYWKFSGGTPTMSTGLSSVSTLVYYVESTTRITAQLLTNVA